MNQQRIFEVIYIRTSITALWDALTNPDVTQRYWFDTRIESDWKFGSKVQYLRNGELTDEHVILSIKKHHTLSHTFKPLFGEFKSESPSRVTLTMEESGEVVRLTIIHDNFPPESKVFRACSDGWPMILCNLKTLLETGMTLPAYTFLPQSARFQ
ncbi:SRPBCC family protein [Methylomonas montana]|uniref:SRPBCC family protein n=1 Tax=Methylomonas montana TaxID=3058963 RepID=UPI002657C8C7|nr:SRPBCC family protein [Methylomonas montana]WKJ89288.1 SRPBCC family protein [Methylomonas montana]